MNKEIKENFCNLCKGYASLKCEICSKNPVCNKRCNARFFLGGKRLCDSCYEKYEEYIGLWKGNVTFVNPSDDE